MSVDCQKLVDNHNITKLNGEPTIWLTEITEVDWTHTPEYVYFLVFLVFVIPLYAYLKSRRRSLIEENEARKQNYLNLLTSGRNAVGSLTLMRYCVNNDIQYNDISDLNITIKSQINDKESEDPPIPFERAIYKLYLYILMCIFIISMYAMFVYPYCFASYTHWDESYKSYVEIECIVFSESRSKELYPDINDERFLYQFFMEDVCETSAVISNTTRFYSSMHYPAQFYDKIDFDPVTSNTPCYLNKNEFNVRGRYRPCCGCECSRCGRAMQYDRCCKQNTVKEQLIASCYCISFCCAPCICLWIPCLFKLFDVAAFEGYELTIGNVEKRTTMNRGNLSLRVNANNNNNTVGSTIKVGEANVRSVKNKKKKVPKETASKSETMHLDEDKREHQEVREWFRNTVKLEQYADLFIDNGFEDLQWIKKVDMNMLVDMEIKKLGHRTRIIQCVDALNGVKLAVVKKDEAQLEIAVSADKYNKQKPVMAYAVEAGVNEGETNYI